jgi:hypothetical protein
MMNLRNILFNPSNIFFMIKHTYKPDPLREKILNLAIRIVKLNQYLTGTKKEYIISKQIFRSGTNPGAMVREAANAELPLILFIN